MKIAVSMLLLLSCHLVSFSQSEANKKMNFGFTFGVNKSQIEPKGTIPDILEFNNGFGFRIGLLADYNLNSHVKLRPYSALSFNEFTVTDSNTESSVDIEQIQLEFGAVAVYKLTSSKLNPYFFAGPAYKHNIGPEFGAAQLREYDSFFAVDFGLGVDKPLNHFRILPEIHYSYALQDVNVFYDYPNVCFHTLSLLIHFTD